MVRQRRKDRGTNRWSHRQAHRQTHRETHIQTYKQTHGQTHCQTGRQSMMQDKSTKDFHNKKGLHEPHYQLGDNLVVTWYTICSKYRHV